MNWHLHYRRDVQLFQLAQLPILARTIGFNGTAQVAYDARKEIAYLTVTKR